MACCANRLFHPPKLTLTPPTGGGLIFSGTLIHEAQPVTRGARYVLLTFLHDAESEARRLAYEAKSGLG